MVFELIFKCLTVQPKILKANPDTVYFIQVSF